MFDGQTAFKKFIQNYVCIHDFAVDLSSSKVKVKSRQKFSALIVIGRKNVSQSKISDMQD